MFEYEAMNEADVMTIEQLYAEMEGMSDFDVMSVDQYKAQAIGEYAMAHAAASVEDNGVCGCRDGWWLTPRDVWVSCPNCPSGPHPEVETPQEQQYVMTGTGIKAQDANGEDFDVVEIVVSTFDIVDFTCITFKGAKGQEHRVSCADLDDAREQCKGFLTQGYKF